MTMRANSRLSRSTAYSTIFRTLASLKAERVLVYDDMGRLRELTFDSGARHYTRTQCRLTCCMSDDGFFEATM